MGFAAMLPSIIALLIQYLPQLLAGVGVISPSLSNLVQQLGAVVPSVVMGFVNAGPHLPSTQSMVTLLQGFEQEIAVLKQSGKLDADALAAADTLTGGIAAALEAYQAAELECDPDTLTPLPETV